MSTIIGVTVAKDGEGFSAFVIDKKGKLHRLSPSWLRDVKEDQLQSFKVKQVERGKFTEVKRLTPVTVGKRIVTGETLPLATARAFQALKRIAVGAHVEIPEVKEVE